MSKMNKEEMNQVESQMEESKENEEKAEIPAVPAVQVKKNFIERAVDKAYDKRVAKAEAKAAKKAEPKPEKTPKKWVKIGAAVAGGATALGLGLLAMANHCAGEDYTCGENQDEVSSDGSSAETEPEVPVSSSDET